MRKRKISKNIRRHIFAAGIFITAIAGVHQNSYAVVATEATQLLILSETAQQTLQQVQQLETAIKQKEAQLMELISLPEATFNQYKSQYTRIVGDYKNLINKYKNGAKNIRNMTDRMKNYDYNPRNLVRTLDDTMTMTNNIIRNNMEALDQYQKTLEKEAKELTPEKQKQEVKSITNVQTGLQVLTHKFVSVNTALSRMTQMLVQNDLEDKAQKQAEYYIKKQRDHKVALEQAGWAGSVKGIEERQAKTNKKLKAPAVKKNATGFTYNGGQYSPAYKKSPIVKKVKK